MVEERSVSLRRITERLSGDIRSANADMSNDNASEKLARRKSKVSLRHVNRRGVSRPLRRG